MEKPADDQFQNPKENLLSKQDHELLLSLPKVPSWDFPFLYQYQGFWCAPMFFHGVRSFQRHFQSKHTDIILSSFPKTGATWLKALAFTIVNRSRYTFENSPLLTAVSHDLVPFLDIHVYAKNRSSILEDVPTPRILATHLPYASLPQSILSSNCRIVYLCRNPLDQFISHLHFAPKIQDQAMEPVPVDEAFEMFCEGVQCFGPIWNHELGYWNASLERSNKVLFLKYEDLKEDTIFNIKKLAGFLGCPFTVEEENQGVIQEIITFCSFDHLKNLEVNQTGKFSYSGRENKMFFRKGKVGDWTNYLTPSMSKRLEKVMEEKLGDSGLIDVISNQSPKGYS